MRLFFFVKDEWLAPEFTRKIADKISHCFLHYAIVCILYLWFGLDPWWCLLIGQVFGIFYEIVFDCWIMGDGVSKFDLLANLIGGLTGFMTIVIGGNHGKFNAAEIF